MKHLKAVTVLSYLHESSHLIFTIILGPFIPIVQLRKLRLSEVKEIV